MKRHSRAANIPLEFCDDPVQIPGRMVSSSITTHLPAELLRAYFRNQLDKPRNKEVEDHLARCPECAARARQGAKVLATLDQWSPDRQEQAFGRLLVRDALRRLGERKPEGPRTSQLQAWSRSDSAPWSALVEWDLGLEGKKLRGRLARVLSLAAGRSPVRVMALATDPARKERTGVGTGTLKGGRELRLRAAGRQQLVVEYKSAGEPKGPAWAMLTPWRQDAVARLRPMEPVAGQVGEWRARFGGLKPGRYAVAVEPPGVSHQRA